MAEFVRVLRELQVARQRNGEEAMQSTIQQVNQAQFQSPMLFAGTANAQLLKSAQALHRVDLVLTVSAVTPVTGAPAWPEDVSNLISNYQLTYSNQVITNMNGNQIGMFNKSRASINGLAALEQGTLVNQTLAQRTAKATAAATFVIHLPGPWDFSPIPYSVCSDYLMLQLQMATLNNILQAGTGTASITNAYLNVHFLQTPAESTALDADALAVINNAGAAGTDKLFLDQFQQSFTIPINSTSFTAQLTQWRNIIQKFYFVMIPTASLQTVGDYKPTDYRTITDMQLTVNGVNVLAQQPVSCSYSQLVLLAENGFLNYVNENVYGWVVGAGAMANDSSPALRPGSGLFIGPANTGSPTLILNFPNTGATQMTLFVFTEVWNAFRYIPVNGGTATNPMKVLN